MNKTIGIVGLGRCGMPAAQKFRQAGYQVFGYARRVEVIEQFQGLGGICTDNPAELAQRAPTVIVMVLNDEQVIEVVTGSHGILAGVSKGSSVICMSTINRANLEWVAKECALRQVDFVDCPFTGGPARVSAGTLTLIAAARQAVLDSCRPILEVLGHINVAGDKPGMGQAIKHCNQLLVTVIHAATIELITLAEKSGINPRTVCEVVGSGIGGNDYFRLLSSAILDDTSSPGGTGQLWKDVNIVVNAARAHNLPLLVATAASHYFNMAKALGMENQDSARMIKVMQRMTQEQL